MGENKNKTKTKAAMLNELESIKGLLLEEDDIPILQEVFENKAMPTPESSALKTTVVHTQETKVKITPDVKTVHEEQQDFFNSPAPNPGHKTPLPESGNSLLDTLGELEKHTTEAAANRLAAEANKALARPSLAKATGENPFLPEHIRARLHGNNPPPLFETETARKIATTSIPTRQLGNTFSVTGASFGGEKVNSHQQDIIDSIVEKMMPEIEKELRSRLEIMTKNMLDEFHK